MNFFAQKRYTVAVVHSSNLKWSFLLHFSALSISQSSLSRRRGFTFMFWWEVCYICPIAVVFCIPQGMLTFWYLGIPILSLFAFTHHCYLSSFWRQAGRKIIILAQFVVFFFSFSIWKYIAGLTELSWFVVGNQTFDGALDYQNKLLLYHKLHAK